MRFFCALIKDWFCAGGGDGGGGGGREGLSKELLDLKREVEVASNMQKKRGACADVSVLCCNTFPFDIMHSIN